MDVIDAAKTFLVTEGAVQKLLEQQTNAEIRCLREENRVLKAIIAEMKRNGFAD